jgi:hypothetical protein
MWCAFPDGDVVKISNGRRRFFSWRAFLFIEASISGRLRESVNWISKHFSKVGCIPSGINFAETSFARFVDSQPAFFRDALLPWASGLGEVRRTCLTSLSA